MRRVVRLALAGAIWVVLLFIVTTAVVANTGRPEQCVPTRGGSICLERGRLPAANGLDSPTYFDRRLSDAILAVTRYGSQVTCYSRADWTKAARRWERNIRPSAESAPGGHSCIRPASSTWGLSSAPSFADSGR